MHFYQLEDKRMDQDFLSGKEVKCRAVINGKDTTADEVNPGQSLLVILSNGKKYKGRLIRFEAFNLESYQIGELVISRMS